ncbi:alcohol dehydrogenase catalytic domain-containing protein [Candidatus Bathyarchaeota archaeon]|nr:alcohol dehydrogenase catalytic domain-containing protein [Candidatus Bathyarchaeota archaeon]MCK4669481.1 alcohol dehydrogenase catalytic domain-containing protein [Candidatus Bathyarchaeota archaeon]
MKAAVYYNQQDIKIEEMPIPEIGEAEALVKMKACGVCGSDLMDWYLKSRAPLVLGHEPTGIISKIGSKVKGFNVGDRVFVHHHVACLTCHYCLSGDYTLCEQFHKTNIAPGGFVEYFRVPAANLQIDTLKISETLSFEEATLIEPVGCCIRALRKSSIQLGYKVAVIGAGTTGIIHTALLKTFGAAKTIVSDLIDYRLQVAKKFGADVTVNPEKADLEAVVKAETDGIGADLVIVTAPSIKAYQAGFSVCRKGGKLCVFAPTHPSKYLHFSPKEMFFSEIQIIPSYSTSHLETRIASELIESGRIKVGELITHRFRLEDAAKAFETALENRKSLKIVVLN